MIPAIRLSERRKAFYFFCGAVPALIFSVLRLIHLYRDPSDFLFVAPAVLYLVGIVLLLGGDTTVPWRKFAVATGLMAVGATQWSWETVQYYLHLDDIRAAGRADLFGATFRAMFLMAIIVAANCLYRLWAGLASNNRWRGP